MAKSQRPVDMDKLSSSENTSDDIVGIHTRINKYQQMCYSLPVDNSRLRQGCDANH